MSGLRFCRNVGEVSAKNRLHPGIQCAVDGEQQSLEPFLKNLRVPQGWALHIEQVWRRSMEKPRSYVRAEKSADRRTDRQHFVFI